MFTNKRSEGIFKVNVRNLLLSVDGKWNMQGDSTDFEIQRDTTRSQSQGY